jgi:hypothetical protein
VSYSEFLNKKQFAIIDAGFTYDGWMPECIFDFQRDLVKWALKRGRAALFCDTGLGKTIMQLTWAYAVQDMNRKPVLIVAPLCVAQQTVREGAKFGIDVDYIREPKFTNALIHITNYEMLKNFNPADYCGIVLDESSILKGMDGKMRASITEFAETIPYRLSCTATPSPNDFMELGTQSEFLGIMSQTEMLAMFFIHDGEDTSKWRLKGHGQRKFWEWLATWSVVIRSPADLGYDATGYDLPPIEYHEHIIETEPSTGLFVEVAMGLQERNAARKESVQERVRMASEIINSIDSDHVIAWCNLNEESDLLSAATGALEIVGADSPDQKQLAMLWFLGDNSLSLVGRKIKQCNQTISKNTTERTEISGWPSQSTGGLIIQPIESNTCEDTTREILKSSYKQKKAKKEKTPIDEQNTHQTQSIETSKEPKLWNTINPILRSKLDNGSESTALQSNHTNPCWPVNPEAVQYAVQRILDAQKNKDCTLTTATQQEKLEDCYAQTAIWESENLKITQSRLDQPQHISKKVLVSKPSIFGYGLNLQHCHHMVFVGLSDSWEKYYQAIRRCWRFGQKHTVHVHIISADTEGGVVANIKRKEKQHKEMSEQMVSLMREFMEKEIKGCTIEKTQYAPSTVAKLPSFLKVTK